MVRARTFKDLLVALLIGTAAALTGCSPRNAATAETTPVEGWSLTVINRHWLDVSIYVMSDGQRTHVGTVSATHTQTYELPSHMLVGVLTDDDAYADPLLR